VIIGFVGLGNMGKPMTAQLLAAGYQVQGYDLSEPARAAFEAAGGTATRNAADAARDAEIVILMLPDSNAVEAVATEPDFIAALAAPPAPAVLVDMSSSEPERTRTLAALLASHGIKLVDAPVSGGVKGAVAGTLAVMTGGLDEDMHQVEEALARFGTVYRVGQVGAGHVVKALNNLMSATHLLITSEAILAGEQFGLDPEAMLAIFNASSGRSGSTENKWPNYIVPETYNAGFGIRLMVKDMRIAVALAEQMKLPSRLGEQATALWAAAAEALPPDADHTEIARWLRSEGRA
jgi:3-hydroxyisobutyrate dehydrogenase